MSLLTATTALLVVLALLTRLRFPRALALAGATPSGAALVLGTRVAVPTFAVVAICGAAWFAYDAFRRRAAPQRFEPEQQPVPGLLALLLFLLWAGPLTLVAPVLFDGLPVVSTAGRLNADTLLTVSNLAQIVYLVLGVLAFALIARDPSTGIGVVGLAAGTTTALSTWALLNREFGLPFPLGVFDNSPVFAYISTEVGGAPRFRGIASEPAALAGAALVTLAFFITALPRVRGRRRALCLALIGAAAWNGVVSTSATFVVAGLAMLGLGLAVVALQFVTLRLRVAPMTVALISVGVVVLVLVLPLLIDLVEASISSKIGSTSFTDRSGSDSYSYELLGRTYGLGVGLGANRPSSFLAALLSTTGLVGAVLFLTAVGQILLPALRLPAVRPAVWATVALLVVKLTSGPDLSDPSGLTWICFGVLAHAVLADRASRSARVRDVLGAARRTTASRAGLEQTER